MLTYAYLKLFIYILAWFVGLLNIAVLYILLKYRRFGNEQFYKETLYFTWSALLIVTMYFFYLFSRSIFGELDNNTVLRVLDILSFLAVKYFWLRIIISISESRADKWKKIINRLFIVFATLLVFNFAFVMDSGYYIENVLLRWYATSVSGAAYLIPLALNIYILAKDFKWIPLVSNKIFLVMTSFLIHLNACWNVSMSIGLYHKRIILSIWDTPIPDPTSFLLLFINLSTLIFVFRKYFSPIYLSSEKYQGIGGQERISEMEMIDNIASKYGLTEREREVAILVYRGNKNSDIAQDLFISVNTVRNHIHNIYIKLNIISRFQLIHLINDQDSTQGL